VAPIAAALLLILGLVAAAIIVGNQQARPAPPFGIARNGLVAFEQDGDIRLGDPLNGTSRVVVGGPEVDSYPGFSFDGTRMVFLRRAAGGDDVVLADQNGRILRILTKVPLVEVSDGAWSGDGRHLLITSKLGGRQTITVFDIETGDARQLHVGVEPQVATFRPPSGRQVLFISSGRLYVVDSDGDGEPLQLGDATGVVWAEWSPDGSQIAYSTASGDVDGDGGNQEVYVIRADGTELRHLEHPAEVDRQGHPKWSPDGTLLLVWRNYRPGFYGGGDLTYAVIPADGSGPGRDVGPPADSGFGAWTWSPDGRVVFTEAGAEHGSLIDVDDGTHIEVPAWATASWQRLAP
jgi:Tol biopolymer transport system component